MSIIFGVSYCQYYLSSQHPLSISYQYFMYTFINAVSTWFMNNMYNSKNFHVFLTGGMGCKIMVTYFTRRVTLNFIVY